MSKKVKSFYWFHSLCGLIHFQATEVSICNFREMPVYKNNWGKKLRDWTFGANKNENCSHYCHTASSLVWILCQSISVWNLHVLPIPAWVPPSSHRLKTSKKRFRFIGYVKLPLCVDGYLSQYVCVMNPMTLPRTSGRELKHDPASATTVFAYAAGSTNTISSCQNNSQSNESDMWCGRSVNHLLIM